MNKERVYIPFVEELRMTKQPSRSSCLSKFSARWRDMSPTYQLQIKKKLFTEEPRKTDKNLTHISVIQLALSPLHNSMECNQFPYKETQNLQKELELYGNFFLRKHTQTCRGLSTSVPENRRPLRILHPKWKNAIEQSFLDYER